MKLLGITLYIILLILSLVHFSLSYYAVLQMNVHLEKIAYTRETENLILTAQRDRWRENAIQCEQKGVQNAMPKLP